MNTEHLTKMDKAKEPLSTLTMLKRDFRAAMNGIAAKAMRDAGMPYHVIFGIELPRLREIAKEYQKDRRFAQHLWNENVRESQLMAIMLTPWEEFLPEVAEIWLSEAKTEESVSLISMELIAKQSWASDYAFRWVASTNYYMQLCGWLTICHLLREGRELQPRSKEELLDQAAAVAQTAPLPLRKVVMNVTSIL